MRLNWLNKFSDYYIPSGWKSFFISLLATLLVSYLHFSVPSPHSVLHLFHFYFFYLIVIYCAHSFGFLGGLVSSFVLSFIYNPKVYLVLHLNSELIRPAIEVIMMYTLGIFSGLFSQRLYLEKEKLRKVSEELKESLQLLEKSMEEKIRMEKEIAKADRLRVLGQLTAGIAHEIRNPLAAIRSGINLIKTGRYDEQIISVVTAEVDRLNSFIERFLQYARIGKGEDRPIKVRELLDEIKELVKLTCKDKEGLTFEMAVEIDETIYVRGDKNYLKQALFNILLNSIEAVSEKRSIGFVKFSAYTKEGELFFEIEDNGPGIEGDLIDKIFEPFFTTKEKGTGLGLTIAGKVIREHGGDIVVESNKGVKVKVKMPLCNDIS